MGPDISASLTTCLAHELQFDIRQPDIIAPLLSVQDDRVRAFVVGAENDDLARPGLAHFSEGYFNRSFHPAILAAGRAGVSPLIAQERGASTRRSGCFLPWQILAASVGSECFVVRPTPDAHAQAAGDFRCSLKIVNHHSPINPQSTTQ